MLPRRFRSRLTATAVVAALLASLTVGTGMAMAAKPAKVFATFDTPGTYTWTVPKGLRRVSIRLFGAQGGPNATLGGLGGETVATLAVQPGQTLQIVVGGTTANFAGGFNGGGNAQDTGLPAGGGGGASDVRIGSCAAAASCGLTARIVVAGGGGGAGCSESDRPGPGGAGGGSSGLAGYPSICGFGSEDFDGGGGGTQTAAGGCSGSDIGYDCEGSFGTGGAGRSGGAGGGGGWFGGGGGFAWAGGGGGSGYIGPSTLGGNTWPGVRAGDGLVVISGS